MDTQIAAKRRKFAVIFVLGLSFMLGTQMHTYHLDRSTWIWQGDNLRVPGTKVQPIALFCWGQSAHLDASKPRDASRRPDPGEARPSRLPHVRGAEPFSMSCNRKCNATRWSERNLDRRLPKVRGATQFVDRVALSRQTPFGKSARGEHASPQTYGR